MRAFVVLALFALTLGGAPTASAYPEPLDWVLAEADVDPCFVADLCGGNGPAVCAYLGGLPFVRIDVNCEG